MQLKVSSLRDENMGQNSECSKSKKMWVLAAHYFSPFFFQLNILGTDTKW